MMSMAKFWSLFLSLKNPTKIDTQKFFKKRKLKTSTNIFKSSSFSLRDGFCEILGRGRSSLRDALKGGEDHEHLQNLGYKYDKKCTNT